MTATFTPAYAPTPPVTHTVEPRVLQAPFGNGYTQRAGDGLNTQRKVYESLTWQILTETEADAIIDFFVARGGYEGFLWTPPDTGQEELFIAMKWSKTRLTATSFNVTASFRQEFDL